MSGWPATQSSLNSLPAPDRIYAIGDIHGRSDLLERLLGMIRRDANRQSGSVSLVFIGDYVDRGRDSRGVIEMLVELDREMSAYFLRGNHDQALLDFLAHPATYPAWRDFGADETLISYGVRPPSSDDLQSLHKTREQLARAIPAAHLRFLNDLRFYVETDRFYFAHAGIRPGVPFHAQSPRDLMWIRDEFLDSSDNFGKTVVHGHSPKSTPVRKRNRIGVDTNAYMSGHLTAAVLERGRCRFLQT